MKTLSLLLLWILVIVLGLKINLRQLIDRWGHILLIRGLVKCPPKLLHLHHLLRFSLWAARARPLNLAICDKILPTYLLLNHLISSAQLCRCVNWLIDRLSCCLRQYTGRLVWLLSCHNLNFLKLLTVLKSLVLHINLNALRFSVTALHWDEILSRDFKSTYNFVDLWSSGRSTLPSIDRMIFEQGFRSRLQSFTGFCYIIERYQSPSS